MEDTKVTLEKEKLIKLAELGELYVAQKEICFPIIRTNPQ